MPLDDGTNDQREDIANPLPEWTKNDITDVVLYGTHASPATAKARAVLDLAGVQYSRRFGKVSTSSYQKFPVLFVNGRQINDSYVITKTLSPILFGTPLSEKDLQAFSCTDCMQRWAQLAGLTGVTGFLIHHLAPFSLALKGAERIRAINPHLREPEEYLRELRQSLDERASPFFAGNAPGALDASLFGCLSVWLAGGEYTMPFAAQAIKQGGLHEWHERMTAIMPDLFVKHGWWPLYT